PSLYSSTATWNRLPPQSSHGVSMVSMNPSSVMITPDPLHEGHAPSELALNNAGFTPFAFAKALRIGSSIPVYVAGLLRREPLIAPWSIATTPSRLDTDPWISELLPEPATPVMTVS